MGSTIEFTLGAKLLIMKKLYKMSNEINFKNEKLDEWGYPIHLEYNF